jgi:hypothetical protein
MQTGQFIARCKPIALDRTGKRARWHLARRYRCLQPITATVRCDELKALSPAAEGDQRFLLRTKIHNSDLTPAQKLGKASLNSASLAQSDSLQPHHVHPKAQLVLTPVAQSCSFYASAKKCCSCMVHSVPPRISTASRKLLGNISGPVSKHTSRQYNQDELGHRWK